VFVMDDPSALYLLNKMGIEADFRRSVSVFRDDLRRAVRKGNAGLLQTVSAGFAAVAPGELNAIDEKWFGRTIDRHRRNLVFAGYAAIAATLLIAGRAGWNRMVGKAVLHETAAVAQGA